MSEWQKRVGELARHVGPDEFRFWYGRQGKTYLARIETPMDTNGDNGDSIDAGQDT
jgi:hypothetical protein